MTSPESSTRMFSEAAETADVVSRQLKFNTVRVARIAQELRQRDPGFIITVARGSSDHAANTAKYLLETRTGRPVCSLGPSVVSVYDTEMKVEGSLCLLISQSGASPDLLAVAEAAQRGGAYVVAVVNVQDSPLAQLADEVLPIHAGPETSVAATKSFIGSLTAIIHLLSEWQDDNELRQALAQSPDGFRAAWSADWSPALETLSKSRDLYVLGRGIGLGIAREAALKFKEVCGLHAEAFSSAEVMHGPVTIARDDFPVLALAQDDATRPGLEDLVSQLCSRDVPVMTAGFCHDDALALPGPSAHPVIEPLLRIQSFYRLVNALSLQMGLDPDSPPYLKKVTSTV